VSPLVKSFVKKTKVPESSSLADQPSGDPVKVSTTRHEWPMMIEFAGACGPFFEPLSEVHATSAEASP
jgi:hypothetical protein